jgi:Ca2+-binding RTX toxin-like protein
VFETIGEGDDTVFADGNFSLTPGAAVEHLWATGVTLGVTLKGNEFNNDIIGSGGFNDKLYGGAGDDTLFASDGLLDGGTGADSMVGFGDMTFVVDNPGDVVVVPFGGGIDLVQASISYALGADLENLTLTGADAIDGTGNALANRITGNANANLLQGGGGIDNLKGGAGNDTLVGGAGNDVLTGGTGADAFRFYGSSPFIFPPVLEGSDVITDFVLGEDRVELYTNSWGGLPAPGDDLSGVGFFSGAPYLVVGPAATAFVGQFVYNTANGKLYWDDNGAFAGGTTLIATFSGAPALTGADIHTFG